MRGIVRALLPNETLRMSGDNSDAVMLKRVSYELNKHIRTRRLTPTLLYIVCYP